MLPFKEDLFCLQR